MNIATILSLLPLILKAVNLAKSINGNSTVIGLIETHGADVVNLVREAGKEIFPTLNVTEQAQAGALRFSPDIVSKIQGQLNKLGAKLVVDGDYGKLTRAAVLKFQNKHALDADGWAGPLTQARLNEVV